MRSYCAHLKNDEIWETSCSLENSEWLSHIALDSRSINPSILVRLWISIKLPTSSISVPVWLVCHRLIQLSALPKAFYTERINIHIKVVRWTWCTVELTRFLFGMCILWNKIPFKGQNFLLELIFRGHQTYLDSTMSLMCFSIVVYHTH